MEKSVSVAVLLTVHNRKMKPLDVYHVFIPKNPN